MVVSIIPIEPQYNPNILETLPIIKWFEMAGDCWMCAAEDSSNSKKKKTPGYLLMRSRCVGLRATSTAKPFQLPGLWGLSRHAFPTLSDMSRRKAKKKAKKEKKRLARSCYYRVTPCNLLRRWLLLHL